MNLLKKTYEKIFGSQTQQMIKECQPILDTINKLEVELSALTDKELQGKTALFRARLTAGETLDDILPEAFATVREAAKRTLNMRHYDVQLLGGIALHRGMVAEMRTGEGKTLVGTLPVYLNALEQKGVHVVTVNDYLAKRDAMWMGPLYTFLGLSVGIIQNQRVSFLYAEHMHTETEGTGEEHQHQHAHAEPASPHAHGHLHAASRKDAYRADITYGTNNEFGFDYLRDNMVQSIDEMVMRPGNEMHYAVVDEIDSILIDEARTPLIISAAAEAANDQYYTFAKLVTHLKETEHYILDEKQQTATLTEQGITQFEQALGVENIYAEGGMRIVHHIEQALKAATLFRRDKEYVVEDSDVIIIDEFTGRKMPGRRYSEGLHQAIEAKEGLPIQQESRTLATITFQNLFRMYTKLSGMTGTALTEEEELRIIYGLDVLPIPTNKPDIRIDRPDRIYKTEAGKYSAVVQQIKACREKGQPILVGTISVEKNEALSLYLTSQGIPHNTLNAKNHEREGDIIAEAGKFGTVTLATNMAGRGVDIKLGGVDAPKEEYARVVAAGGLFVLGTERHESRRIDNQLRGRSARQGDPGETHFFVSTEDDLMRIFSGDRLKAVMTRLNVPDDMPIEQAMVSKMLENAQKKVEAHNYDIRKHLLEYDDILNKQRHVIYKKRRMILDIASTTMGGAVVASTGDVVVSENKSEESVAESSSSEQKTYTKLSDMILEMIEQEIELIVSFHTNAQSIPGESYIDDTWDVEKIYAAMQGIFSLTDAEKQALFALAEGHKTTKLEAVMAREELVQFFLEKGKERYAALETQIKNTAASIGENTLHIGTSMQELEKQVLIRAIDSLWVDYLVQMNYLRTGIGLRGYAQRDPLLEYKRESYGLFQELLSHIQKEVVSSFFKVDIALQLAPSIMAGDSMVLEGAKKQMEKSSSGAMVASGAPKQKMSKKDRKRLKAGR